MDTDDSTRQRSIQAPPCAGARDGDAPAVRASQVWTRLARHLGALIGETGYCALYGRALRLAAPRHPCLTARQPPHTAAALLAILKEDLASIDPADADRANRALLDTFTKLLSGLIGEALTTRLLNTAWADEPEEKNNE